MLNKDFKEFIILLNKHDVKYLLVGGYAVAVHGYPRYTKDLDIWIAITVENADRINKALNDFGFGELDLSPADFRKPGQVIQLGLPPNRIDIITTLTSLEFDDCYDARLVVNVDGVNISIIDRLNLKKNKLATGRPQDLADADNI